MPNSLRELQRWMRWIITDPRGVDVALADPSPALPGHPCAHRFAQPEVACLDRIDSQGPLDPSSRLSVYAEGYFLRLLEVAEEDFVMLKRILGADHFRQLIIDYLVVHPSQSPTVSELGRHLPEALAHHPLAEEFPHCAEAAALEWQLIEAFYSPRLPAIDSARMAAANEAQWNAATFELDPSFRFFDMQWPWFQLWPHRRDEGFDFSTPPPPRKYHAFLLCSADELMVKEITAAQKKILQAMDRGTCLGEILKNNPTDTALVMHDFSHWLSLGVIGQIHFPSGEQKL